MTYLSTISKNYPGKFTPRSIACVSLPSHSACDAPALNPMLVFHVDESADPPCVTYTLAVKECHSWVFTVTMFPWLR